MKRTLFAVALALASLVAQAADPVCYTFNGQKLCPEEVKPKVRPCETVSCLYDRPVLPEKVVTVIVPPPLVIAPTDSAGYPTKFVNLCDSGGCGVREAPVVVEAPRPYVPSDVYMFFPGSREVSTVITWGPMRGTGPWGLPSGPPLRRRK